MQLTRALFLKQLPHILRNLPEEWLGTTFENHELLGREKFAQRLSELIVHKCASQSDISESDLSGLGQAEDYLRVSSNVSATLELLLATSAGLDMQDVFTFGSKTFPVVATLLVAGQATVHLYTGTKEAPFTKEQEKTLQLFGCNLLTHSGKVQKHPSGEVVVAYDSAIEGKSNIFKKGSGVHAVVNQDESALYILDRAVLKPDDVLVIRKRMATPMTTPAALSVLNTIAGVPDDTNIYKPSDSDLRAFYSHLQTMCGTEVNESPEAQPVIFTAGLPALCSLYTSFIASGGVDVLMCSTAYGGSNQLTDIITKRTGKFVKHTFDIQGEAKIDQSIQEGLNKLVALGNSLQPITMLFVEIPTNPDMKVPHMKAIAAMLFEYHKRTGKQVVLVVDATFAPHSKVMKQIKELSPELPVLSFISMSKSVSRGKTTAGGIIANHTAEAIKLLQGVAATAATFDTTAKDDQLQRLVQNHVGVEKRCADAYETAVFAGRVLVDAVKEATGQDMPLAFVSPQDAAAGFTTSTFSFNLPSLKEKHLNAGLAQRFVDLLTAHSEFKPCVSFGQDNHRIYATVPATSTQGALKEEDKAKQAVGGVQLTRLSFPPTIDRARVAEILQASVRAIYPPQSSNSIWSWVALGATAVATAAYFLRRNNASQSPSSRPVH